MGIRQPAAYGVRPFKSFYRINEAFLFFILWAFKGCFLMCTSLESAPTIPPHFPILSKLKIIILPFCFVMNRIYPPSRTWKEYKFDFNQFKKSAFLAYLN